MYLQYVPPVALLLLRGHPLTGIYDTALATGAHESNPCVFVRGTLLQQKSQGASI